MKPVINYQRCNTLNPFALSRAKGWRILESGLSPLSISIESLSLSISLSEHVALTPTNLEVKIWKISFTESSRVFALMLGFWIRSLYSEYIIYHNEMKLISKSGEPKGLWDWKPISCSSWLVLCSDYKFAIMFRMPKLTPNYLWKHRTCRNFVELCKAGYYDGTQFHVAMHSYNVYLYMIFFFSSSNYTFCSN